MPKFKKMQAVLDSEIKIVASKLLEEEVKKELEEEDPENSEEKVIANTLND